MKNLFLFIFALVTSLTATAQTYCSGKVMDIKEQPLGNASVMVKDTLGTIMQYVFTKDDDTYKLGIEPKGTFLVEVNKLSYEIEEEELVVTKNKKNYSLDFMLEEKSQELETIVINTEASIKHRGDTLVFDARAFEIGNEQVIEDVLKNIPGITVQENGQIKFNDKRVSKVMVGGDDLFNNGYSMLTKNMPNKPVDKVEVLQNYSENKLLKGIENSEAVAINLTLEDEFKSMWFGNIFAAGGYGKQTRYDLVANLMTFNKKFKTFLNLGGNNVSEDRVGDLGSMFFNNYSMNQIRGQNIYGLMSMGGGGGSGLKRHRTLMNNNKHISTSTIVPITDKFKVTFKGFFGLDEKLAYNSSTAFTKTNNTSFTNTTANENINNIRNAYVNVNGTYDIGKNQLLDFSTVWSAVKSDKKNRLNFNGLNTTEELQSTENFIDQKVTLTHRWKERNAVIIKTRLFSTKIPQVYDNSEYLLGDLFSNSPDRIRNNARNEKLFGGIAADFKLRQKNNDLINFEVGYLHNNQNLQRNFQLFKDDIITEPENFQARTKFSLGDLYATSGYSFDWDIIKLNTSADVHQLFNQWESETSTKQNKNPLYVNPTVRLTWDVAPSHTIYSSYRLNYSTTGIKQVNDQYLLGSSRSFSRGLGSFELMDRQSTSLSYKYTHYLQRYSFNLGADYSQRSEALSSRSTLDQNSSLSEQIFIKGGDTFSINQSCNYYIRNWKSNLRLSTSYSKSVSFNEINNSGLRKNTSHYKTVDFSWSSSFERGFNFRAGTEWRFSETISPSFSNTNTNGFSSLDLMYVYDNFDVKATTEHYYFGGLPTKQQNHLFLDLEASYKFKGDNWTVSLRGNNLFNKSEFTTLYISDLGYSRSTYQLMERYVLLGVKYLFN